MSKVSIADIEENWSNVNHKYFKIEYVKEEDLPKVRVREVTFYRHFDISWILIIPDANWYLPIILNHKKYYYTPKDEYSSPNLELIEKFIDYNMEMILSGKNNVLVSEQVLYQASIYINIEKMIKKYLKYLNFECISKYYELIIYFEKFPNENWIFHFINTSCYFKINWVFLRPDFDWDFDFLSNHKKFEISWIEILPKKEWNFKILSSNKKFTFELLDKYPNKEWDFDILSNHKSFKIDWVKKYPYKKWNFDILSSRENFEIEWIDKFMNRSWNYQKISKTKNFCLTWLDKYPNKNWDFKEIQNKKNLYINYIDKYPFKDWDFKKIINRKNLMDSTRFYYTFQKLDFLQKLDNEELRKYFILRKYIPEILKDELNNTILNNILQPIELQDLCGDIYYLDDWIQQENILFYARQKYPHLKIHDIYIGNSYITNIYINDTYSNDEFLLASKTNSKLFKIKLCYLSKGPQGMIVYN